MNWMWQGWTWIDVMGVVAFVVCFNFLAWITYRYGERSSQVEEAED